MASTVHEPPKIEGHREPPHSHERFTGGGQNLIPGAGNLPAVKHYSPPPASTGIWVVLASITMTFAAFTSALIVRQGSALDWRHLTLPNILYVNTLILLASGGALEMARRRSRVLAGTLHAESGNPSRWLYGALFWFAMHAYVVQLLVHVAEPRIFDIYRRAALIALGHPLFTVLILLEIVVIGTISLIFVPAYVLVGPSYLAMVQAHAFREIRRRHGDLVEEVDEDMAL